MTGAESKATAAGERAAHGPGDAPAPARGLAADSSDPARLRAVIDMAIDYRGDVTITRRSSGEAIEGYLFARAEGGGERREALRLLPASGGTAVCVEIADVARIELTGRDTAEGKSFEKWLERYVERKLAGRPANIE